MTSKEVSSNFSTPCTPPPLSSVPPSSAGPPSSRMVSTATLRTGVEHAAAGRIGEQQLDGLVRLLARVPEDRNREGADAVVAGAPREGAGDVRVVDAGGGAAGAGEVADADRAGLAVGALDGDDGRAHALVGEEAALVELEGAVDAARAAAAAGTTGAAAAARATRAATAAGTARAATATASHRCHPSRR